MPETDTLQEQHRFLAGTRVQRANPIPLYLQVSEALRQAIATGELKHGEELPTEAQLCDLYGVSRITVRQAIAELLGDGTLTRPRPRGPLLVSPTRILREVSELSGPFVEEVLGPGMRRRTEVISARSEAAASGPATHLGIAAGSSIVHIQRLHFGDEIPLACQSSWLPETLVPGLLNHSLSGSLQLLCETHYGLRIARKVQRISARVATTEESSLLNLDRRSPVLELDRTAHLPDGRVLEYTVYTLRADRFTIVSELNRPS